MSGPFNFPVATGLVDGSDAAPITVGSVCRVDGQSGRRLLGVGFDTVSAASLGTPTALAFRGDSVTFEVGSNTAFETVDTHSVQFFDDPVVATDGEILIAAVHFPQGGWSFEAGAFDDAVTSSDMAELSAPAGADSPVGNGVFVEGSDNIFEPPVNASGTHNNYGVFGIWDTGSSTIQTVTGTVTDPLEATATQDLVLTGFSEGARAIRRSPRTSRIMWGGVANPNVKGPVFATTAQRTMGPQTKITGEVDSPRVVAVEFYKAPAIDGDVTVTIWSLDGTALATKLQTFTADDGGWVTVELDDPVAFDVGDEFITTYHTPNGVQALADDVFEGQETCFFPLTIRDHNQGHASLYVLNDDPDVAPTAAVPTDFYVYPVMEWDVATEAYDGDQAAYLDQWGISTGGAFPVAVWFPPAEAVPDYADLGINLIMAADIVSDGGQSIVDAGVQAVAATVFGGTGASRIPLDVMAENADLAALVIAFLSYDEPDMNLGDPDSAGFGPKLPEDLLGYGDFFRIRWSLPVLWTMGLVSIRSQGFGYQPPPPGTSLTAANALWRQDAALSEIVTGDNYSLSDSTNAAGNWGIWTYAATIHRLRDLCDDTRPVWGIVETTSTNTGQPTPDQVVKAVWAMVIAGAQGVTFFDQGGEAGVFAAMLEDDAGDMRDAVTALAAQLQDLAGALLAPPPDLDVTVDSSDTTAGPLGGTLGVPIHFAARSAGGTTYLLTQAIRPGSTTGTFTVPDAAGATITVIGESRTLTADGDGVFADDFTDDYAVHLYSWS